MARKEVATVLVAPTDIGPQRQRQVDAAAARHIVILHIGRLNAQSFVKMAM